MFPRKGTTQFACDLVVIETLHGGDAGALAHRSKRDAGAGRNAIDQQGAGATDTVLATDMRARQILRFAQKVGEMGSRFNNCRGRRAVYNKRDLVHLY